MGYIVFRWVIICTTIVLNQNVPLWVIWINILSQREIAMHRFTQPPAHLNKTILLGNPSDVTLSVCATSPIDHTEPAIFMMKCVENRALYMILGGKPGQLKFKPEKQCSLVSLFISYVYIIFIGQYYYIWCCSEKRYTVSSGKLYNN